METTKKQINGKLPPQALDLERAVLGGMLIDRRGVEEALEVFTDPEVFYLEKHQLIFRAIVSLFEASQPVDLITVSDWLKSKKLLERAGDHLYLIELTQEVASAAHINYHSFILLQKFVARKYISLGQDMVTLGYDPGVDVFDLQERVESMFTNITEMITRGRQPMTWEAALRQVPKKVELLSDPNRQGKLTGVPTGLRSLDAFTGGWQFEDFIVIGARPGMGKTALVVKNMLAAAMAGYTAGFISMEMSTLQVATRALAIESNYHLKQLTRTGFEHAKYFTGLNKAVDRLAALNILVDDRPSLTIGEIKRKARSWKRKHDLGFFIVDYIQLGDGEVTGGNRNLEIGKISRGLKHIAKELEIPVIGLSQLSRDVEKSATKRPGLHHLRESGDIEADADAVVFIYRPEYYGLEPDMDILEPGQNTEFIFMKHRSGGVGTVGGYFEANKTRFLDYAPVESAVSDGEGGVPF